MYTADGSGSVDNLVETYAPLVKRIGHHLLARMPASVQLDDLLQAGMIGLLEASRNYDASKGASFETYAGIRVRGAMIDEVRKGDWVPRSVHRNARKVSEAIKLIESRTGRDASDKEIAQELGVDIDSYFDILKDTNGSRLFSLEEMSGEDDSTDKVPGDSINPLDDYQQSTLKQQIAAQISELPERERLVLALYYDEEMNLKEIGMVLNVSESRVSQIHSQATLRLRSRLAGWGG